MNKIIIIPVREDSKRLPGKALLEVNNEPLWYHTYLQCTKANVDRIWIATDSRRILECCVRADISCIEIKNAWCGTERVAKAYRYLQKLRGITHDDDLILNVQADYPQIQPKSINLLFEQCSLCYELWDFLTLYYTFDSKTCYEAKDKNIVKIIGSEINNKSCEIICHYFTREFYPWSFGHIGLYLFQLCNIENILTHSQSYLSRMEGLEQNTWISNAAKIKALYTDRELSVDTQEDFDRFKQETET